jgi:hypothetical protein
VRLSHLNRTCAGPPLIISKRCANIPQEVMSTKGDSMPIADDRVQCPLARTRSSRGSRRLIPVGGAGLIAGVLSSGLSVAPAAAALTPSIMDATGPGPGTIFVANAGSVGATNAGPGTGTGLGSVTLYRPGATGNVRPEARLTVGVNGPGGLTFDSSGNLWVANTTTDTVVEYSKAELGKASPVPTVTISSDSSHDLSVPGGVAFDGSGNLWVANEEATTVVEFTKAQLAKSGSPIAREAIARPSLCSIAFDRAGDLWEGSFGNSLSEFTKGQLAISGLPAPSVTLSSSSLDEPCRPAFDSSGDLWTANYGNNTVTEYSKAQLAQPGSRDPKITISFATSLSLDTPGDVALDSSGSLWVPNASNNTVVEFTKAELAKSGSPAPTVTIKGAASELNWPWSVAIEP